MSTGESTASARPAHLRVIAGERALHARLRARDERALAELIDVASPWLLGVATAILHDTDEAEDVVIESFRVVWELVADSADEPLMPLLLRIARNRAIDRLRSRGRAVARAVRAARLGTLPTDDVAPVEPDEAGTPGWHVHAAVHAALGTLAAERRELVDLAYFHGMTQSEIAARLGMPIGTVKTRLRAAYSQLREALAPLKGWLA